jgi:myo-inositol-1(or 4)-monophosphatase
VDPERVAPSSELDELTALTVELAEGAAAQVRDAAGSELTIASKTTTTDLVTDADRRVERWLIDELRRRRPGDAVLGEEGGNRSPGAEPSAVRWVLDPIDGTVNFVLGLPQFAVSVAVEVGGSVVAGAVANPITGETFSARRGAGAFCGTRRLPGPRAVPLERAVVATGFAYDPKLRSRQIAVVAPLLPRIADIRRLGAAALDLCYVAAGRVDAYFEAGLHTWDYAAGALIAAEAGCRVTGLRGQPPSNRFLAVAGPALAPDFFALLQELDADQVSNPTTS